MYIFFKNNYLTIKTIDQYFDFNIEWIILNKYVLNLNMNFIIW